VVSSELGNISTLLDKIIRTHKFNKYRKIHVDNIESNRLQAKAHQKKENAGKQEKGPHKKRRKNSSRNKWS
jgi:hypothetical protein